MTRLHLLFVAMAIVLGGSAHAGGEKEDAKERFEKGVSLFNAGDYEAALVEFRAAYSAVPHYAVRYNLGITLYELHRYAEAKEEFEAFLAEGGDGIEEDRREEVETLLASLESLVSTLVITVNAGGARLFLNGTFLTDLEPETWLILDVGEYDFEVRAKGWESWYEHIEVPGGKVIEIDVVLESELGAALGAVESQPEPSPTPTPTLPPQPPVKKRKPVAFWTLLGLTLASGIGGGVLEGMFLAGKSEYDDMGWEDDWQQKKDEIAGLAIGADLMIGLTAAFTVATIVTGIVTLPRGKERKVAIVPGPGALSIAGVF